MRNIRRQHLENKKKVRRLILYTIGILFFIYLTTSLILGDGGLMRYAKLQLMRDDLLAEINEIKKRNEAIKTELEKNQKDETLIEELARQRGLSKDGELIIKFNDEKEDR